MKVRLDYGKDGLWVDLPSERVMDVLDIKVSQPLRDPGRTIRERLLDPIASPPLSDLAKGRKSACVVISDITRPVPNQVILPPLLEMLEENGIARNRITLLVATGIHRPTTEEELISMVGEKIFRNYRIVNHMARKKETMTYLGETSAGAPIFVDSTYLAADLKVTTALIEPHLMAGYSGGRKTICPGICGVETMRVLHGPELMGSPRAAEGIIEGNPFHEQALEVAKRVGVDIILNVSMDAARRITGIFAGDLEKAHEAGMRFVAQQATAYVPEPVDIVVTTGAGYPLDLTFYQIIKGMTAVLPILKEGGTTVIASQCAEGIGGPEFTSLLRELEGPEDFEERIRTPDFFMIDQWQIQELCKALGWGKVYFYTEEISREEIRNLMVTPISSVAEGVEGALAEYGKDARIAVIPKGPYVMPRVKEAETEL